MNRKPFAVGMAVALLFLALAIWQGSRALFTVATVCALTSWFHGLFYGRVKRW